VNGTYVTGLGDTKCPDCGHKLNLHAPGGCLLTLCGCVNQWRLPSPPGLEDQDVVAPEEDQLFETSDEYAKRIAGDLLAGVAPDTPTTTNEQGGSQSDIPYRFDLIDAKALFAMAEVLDQGAKKYGEDNWRLIPVKDHLNHLLMHAYAYLAGDTQDDHLSHILCRATFALGVTLAEPSKNTAGLDSGPPLEAGGLGSVAPESPTQAPG
jgi:hypothetical protein